MKKPRMKPFSTIEAPWHIAVLIPARNEEELLLRCLHSVLAARARLPITVTCDIIVAVDSSTDRTREIASAVLGFSGIVFSTEAGAVGQTRALAAHNEVSLIEASYALA